MRTSSGEFSVQQDNWVYAPNGGRWTPTKYSNLNAWSNFMREGSIYIPTSRFISAVSKLNDDTVTLDLNPNGDIDKQLDKLLTNTGMLVEQDEIDSARNAILAVAGTTTVSIILIVFPEPSSTAVGTKKLAHMVVQIITAFSDVATYSGTPSAISTFMAYAEQYSFSRAFKEGDRNVFTTKYSTSIGRSWNPWTSAPYINKFSLGDHGTVDKNITDQNIIDWCGWKVLEAAK